MTLTRVPGPPLSELVSFIWYEPCWAPVHSKELHMPDGLAGLIVTPEAGSDHEAIIVGPCSRAFVIDTSRPMTVMGVALKPGAASAFVSTPVSELENLHVALSDVAGAHARSLSSRILEAQTSDSRMAVMEAWLVEALRRPARDQAVSWAARQFRRNPQRRIADITSQIGLSSRRFIERFRGEVGLTPKLFSRLQRFQWVLSNTARVRRGDLADLAAACGYFDQAHFAHDFREFAGITPSAYLATRTEHQNHVVLPD